MAEIKIRRSVNEENDRIAAENKARFDRQCMLVVDMMGSPGAGKTTLLEHILPKLAKKAKTAVIEGDLETDNDARRVAATGVGAVQINTNGGCHLDARMVAKRLDDKELAGAEILIIENVGNLVCPASYPLGEHVRMVILSLPEGDDKPEKYPVAFLNANTVAVTKTDLGPYVHASADVMAKNIHRVNPKARVFMCSMKDDEYDDGGLTDYLLSLAEEKKK